VSDAAGASGAAARLSWWDIIGGIVLPILAIAAQVSLLQGDTVGPWLCRGYSLGGIVALFAATKFALNPSHRSFICGANFPCAAGSLLNALDHFLFSYFYAWLPAVVLISPPARAAAQVNARKGIKLFRQRVRSRQVALGAFINFVPPVVTQMTETRWVAATMVRLQDADIDDVADAVQRFNEYPLRFGRFGEDVCEQVVIGRRGIPGSNKLLDSEIVKMLGPKTSSMIASPETRTDSRSNGIGCDAAPTPYRRGSQSRASSVPPAAAPVRSRRSSQSAWRRPARRAD